MIYIKNIFDFDARVFFFFVLYEGKTMAEKKSPLLVGTNLHECLRMLASGKVDIKNVAFIFTNLPINQWDGKDGWVKLIGWWEEKNLYHKDFAQVRVILEGLFHSKRLVSPRCSDNGWSVWLEEEAGNPLWVPMDLNSLLAIRWIDGNNVPPRAYFEGLVRQFEG